MNGKFKVNISDLAKSVRYAIDIRKMLIGAGAIICFLFLENVFIKIIAIIQHRTFAEVVLSYFTINVARTIEVYPWSSILFFALLSVAFGVFSFFLAIIGRMVHQELVQYKYPQLNTALNFARRRWFGLLFGPIGYILFLVFLAFLETALILIARIPVVGEIYYSFMIVPLFFYNVFFIFLVFCFIFVFNTMYPAVFAAEDTTSSSVIISIINLLKRKPIRLIFYKLLMLFWGAVSAALVVITAIAALSLFGLFSRNLLGSKFDAIVSAVPFLGAGVTKGFSSFTISGVVSFISLLLIFLLVLGYLFDYLVVSDTILYLALKERILEEDREEVNKLIFREEKSKNV